MPFQSSRFTPFGPNYIDWATLDALLRVFPVLDEDWREITEVHATLTGEINPPLILLDQETFTLVPVLPLNLDTLEDTLEVKRSIAQERAAALGYAGLCAWNASRGKRRRIRRKPLKQKPHPFVIYVKVARDAARVGARRLEERAREEECQRKRREKRRKHREQVKRRKAIAKAEEEELLRELDQNIVAYTPSPPKITAPIDACEANIRLQIREHLRKRLRNGRQQGGRRVWGKAAGRIGDRVIPLLFSFGYAYNLCCILCKHKVTSKPIAWIQVAVKRLIKNCADFDGVQKTLALCVRWANMLHDASSSYALFEANLHPDIAFLAIELITCLVTASQCIQDIAALEVSNLVGRYAWVAAAAVSQHNQCREMCFGGNPSRCGGPPCIFPVYEAWATACGARIIENKFRFASEQGVCLGLDMIKFED
jgi:hypothetical protein